MRTQAIAVGKTRWLEAAAFYLRGSARRAAVEKHLRLEFNWGNQTRGGRGGREGKSITQRKRQRGKLGCC